MVSLNEGLRRPTRDVAAIAPLSESVEAIAVIVLAVLGLVNVAPGQMLGIVTIVVGAGLVMQAVQMAAELSELQLSTGVAAGQFGGGMALRFIAGVTGIILGILALFSHTAQLAPAALIVFGGAMLLGGGVGARLNLIPDGAVMRPVDLMVRESAMALNGSQILVGVGAIVPGILALILSVGATLNLVGLLAVGAALLLSGAASAGTVIESRSTPFETRTAP